MQKYSGVTLVELMVTLLVAAILGTLAVPQLSSLAMRRRLDAAVSALTSDFSFARSEALKRGHSVTICQSVDGRYCDRDAGSWHGGWIVFDNPTAANPPTGGSTGAGVPAAASQILRRQQVLAGILFLGNETLGNTERYVHYRASGLATGHDNRFVVTADANDADGNRLLCMKLGRLQLRPPRSQPPC